MQRRPFLLTFGGCCQKIRAHAAWALKAIINVWCTIRKELRGANASTNNQYSCVITSYSIHYTKLYENYSLLAYNLQHSTRRDINKRQGQVLELKYSSLPFSDDDKQNLLAMHTRLYFPGMGRHHAIRIDNDVQTKEKGKPYLNNDGQNVYPSFTDYVTFPRGVLPQPNDQLYSFKGDYMLPLLDPDLNISYNFV